MLTQQTFSGQFYDHHPHGISYSLSPHAIERALEMSVEGEEITNAMKYPEKSYFNEKYGNWCLTAGRLTICVSTKRAGVARIVSVLWATQQGWLDDYARGGITDRKPREVITTSK